MPFGLRNPFNGKHKRKNLDVEELRLEVQRRIDEKASKQLDAEEKLINEYTNAVVNRIEEGKFTLHDDGAIHVKVSIGYFEKQIFRASHRSTAMMRTVCRQLVERGFSSAETNFTGYSEYTDNVWFQLKP
jgi:hypothetical protein